LARFTNVDAALEEGCIPDSDARCSHIAGYRTFTPDVNAIAGSNVAGHLAKNHHFTGSEFAETRASRLTVTRLSCRVIAPSTSPSMYNDSEPITTPLICRLLPMVAGSATVGDTGKVLEGRMVVASWLAATGTDDSVGSSLEDSEGVPGSVCSLFIVDCSQFALGIIL
jgi:hypothetical protein